MATNYLPSLAIVTPCFNEEIVIERSIQKLFDKLQSLSKKSLIDINNSKIVVVDDGSLDDSWNILKKIHSEESKIHCIKLSRNFGHQNALLSGMLNSTEDLIITIDIDLQDDLDAMDEMILEYSKGFEIVYGVKKDRSLDGFLKIFFASSFYSILSFLGANVIRNHADFRLLSQKAIKALGKFKEINIYLRGMIPLLGFQSTTVEYNLIPRLAGEPKYGYRKSLSLALNGITSFSLIPLRIIGILGFVIAFFSISISCYYLYESIFTDNTIPGWASTVLPIYFLGAIQLISLGVISEYIGKLFLQSKKRPNFIIEEVLE